MILTDSSVVIDFERSADPNILHLILANAAGICGGTRAEVLHGARDAAHRVRMLTDLQVFQQVSIPEPLWDDVGDNLAALRRSGITVPFQDAVIATVAIANDVELWTHDNQFKLIQTALPQLRLFVEPP
jgi:predicted nucleic acid-binding protein